jgi:hypothetical protein
MNAGFPRAVYRFETRHRAKIARFGGHVIIIARS